MRLAKLDVYDYIILPGVIRIRLDDTNDPYLGDIMSEVDRSGGNIYIEGCRYSYLNNYRIFKENKKTFIELYVVEAVQK